MQNFLQFSLNKSFRFDSRNCKEGSIFIALEGGGRSGLEFVQSAFENGAIGVISQKEILDVQNFTIHTFPENFEENSNFNLVVEDSLKFIQELAKEKFRYLSQNGTKTIAITGSVGKTTTKELIANTLNQHAETFANFGNYNNHIGVPVTILNCPVTCKFLVLEMGMNHAGEIADLITIAPCDFRIITNAKENHAGNFPNGLDGVLEAKFEIMQGDGKFKTFITHELFERFCHNLHLVENHQLKKQLIG
jgi:UDP-N-acetylmuramoyl-tripeptide--D-alanyl-D-alanine ligase